MKKFLVLKDSDFWVGILLLLCALLMMSSMALAAFALSDFTDNQNTDLAFSRYQWSMNLFLSSIVLAVISRLIYSISNL